MKHLLNLIFCVALCLSMTVAVSAAPITEPPPTVTQLTLTLLHTNDIHGHLFPFAYTEIGRSPIEQPSVGGAARRATLIRELRQEIKNPVMLVDSGDLATRGPLATTYEGLADVEAMNAIGYEAMAVGNNEFKLKDGVDQNDAAGAQAALLRVIKRSRFPWLCANVVDGKGAPIEGVEPYIVRNFNGVRVGFIGLTAPKSISYPQTKGWTIIDYIAAAKEWIPKARANCDVLIALTHLGTDYDEKLAAQTTGLDAIVGGDSHTYLYKAVEVANPDGIKVPIVQDGEFGVDLGRFDLHFTKDTSSHWHLADYKYALIPVRPPIKEAPDVAAVLLPYLQPLLKVVGTVDKIGATPSERDRLTTQVLVDALRYETHSDIAVNPFPSDSFEVFRHRKITRYDVLAVLPFHDDAATVELTGMQIKAILNGKSEEVTSGDIAHLDDDRQYKVAMIDYAAASVYKLPANRITDTGLDSRDVVIDYLGQI